MSLVQHLCSNARVHRDGFVSRRDFLRGLSTTAVAAGTLGWSDLITAQAAELRREGRACILLYMQGGPSQFETFAPLPDHPNGGGTKALATKIPGMTVAEYFPKMATAAEHFAILRSLTGKEGSHPRASYLMHTGYLPTASIKHPAIGAIAASELASSQNELPSYVRIGGRGNFATGGFLGVKYDPFDIANPEAPPTNTKPSTERARFEQRMALMNSLQADFAQSNPAEVHNHRQVYEQSARMILSPQMEAFDLSRESQKMRDSYGGGTFAGGCLLARRLIEAGVPFVEVVSGNWDTHQDNADRIKGLAGQTDQPMARLLTDLKERGLLEKTLVVWMGEFGRTPNINPRGGRDHYPRAFCGWMAGAGVKGGQAIGKVDRSGAGVADRPVQVNDFFQTICHALRIDAKKENMSSVGRPIKVVDGGEPVLELFG